MMNLTHITQEQADWILNDYNKIRNHSYINGYINEHVKFQSIIRNKKVERPECGCEFSTFQAISNSLYEQHYDTIVSLYK